MKTKFVLSAVLCLLPFLGQAQNVLPDIEVKDLEGQACSIKTALDGSTPVILTFWSTTCKPCLQELGAMNDAYVDWSDEADFKIVAVARDDARSSSKVAPMVKGRGWTDFNYYLDENGDLANWIIPGKKVAGMGGAMDLVSGAKEVIIAMTHTQKGNHKILEKCTLPLTAEKCVNLIVTEMGVMKVTDEGLVVTELHPDYTKEDIQAATGCKLIFADDLKPMEEE